MPAGKGRAIRAPWSRVWLLYELIHSEAYSLEKWELDSCSLGDFRQLNEHPQASAVPFSQEDHHGFVPVELS